MSRKLTARRPSFHDTTARVSPVAAAAASHWRGLAARRKAPSPAAAAARAEAAAVDGRLSMAQYAGMVVLVVNVASK